MSDPGLEPTLADVQDEFPGWECSVSFGFCWAHLRDDPDVTVRGEYPLDLRDSIIAAVAGMTPG